MGPKMLIGRGIVWSTVSPSTDESPIVHPLAQAVDEPRLHLHNVLRTNNRSEMKRRKSVPTRRHGRTLRLTQETGGGRAATQHFVRRGVDHTVAALDTAYDFRMLPLESASDLDAAARSRFSL